MALEESGQTAEATKAAKEIKNESQTRLPR